MTKRRFTAMLGVVGALAFAVATAQAATTAKAKCNNSNPVLIGTIYTMSGPGANFGQLSQQGATLAIRDINASGGMLGRCVKQDLKDDKASPTTAAQVVREAIDQDHVQFIVGPFLSSPSAVVLPVATQAKVIDMNESAYLDAGDASKFPYNFSTEIHSDLQSQIFIPFLKSHHWTRVGILAPNNAFGTDFVPTFTDLAKKAGITVVKSALVVSGSPDVTPEMSQLKDANPQALVWAVNADPDQIAALKARNALGWNVPVAAVSSIYNTGTTNNFTSAQLSGVYGYAYKSLTFTEKSPNSANPLTRKFIKEFSKWIHAHGFKESISQSAGAYDSFILLAQAVNAAKSLDPDKIKNYLETHGMDGVRGHYVWNAQQHRGLTLADFTFVHAKPINRFGLTMQVK